MEEYNITKKGLNQLKKELDELKNVKKWEVAKWLKEAAEGGDMDENSEYVAAKEAQTALETRISELESKIRNAKVIKRRRKDIVEVGSKVEYTPHGSSTKKFKITLVSTEEADASNGKISIGSPIGKALRGKKKGDKVEVHTPKGKKKYKIIRIA
ncbi:MAG: transcription elongation factor GreA [Candidatus Spechtbacterales bacterium]|nr:transcription elongation factor GreA [Candidatus Spechtbacterales bacterium]